MELSTKFVVTAVTGKTMAHVFRNTVVDDVLHITLPLKRVGWYRHPRTAKSARAKIENMRTSEVTYKTLNELANILENFEMRELK